MKAKIKRLFSYLWNRGHEFLSHRFPFFAAFVKRWFLFFRDVVDEFLTDNCPHLAASISYYVLLALFPLTLALVSLLGFISASPEMESRIIDGLGNILPVSREFITSSIQGVIDTRAVTGAIGVIGLLIAGNAVFTAVRKSLNAAWGIRKPRPFLTERLIEFGMMTGAALLLLLSIAVSASLSILRNQGVTVFGTDAALFWNIMGILISTIIMFVVFLLLYKFVPCIKVRWRDIWLGALLAAIGFEVTQNVFVWYTANYGHYNLIYGPIGSIIALLIWVYVSAIIFLFCAKMTAVHSRRPAPTAVLLDMLRATMTELRQRLTDEPQEIASTVVKELDEHVTPVVTALQQYLTAAMPIKEGKRSIRALFRWLKFRRAKQQAKSSGAECAGSATSSLQERRPQ